jgi:hypothetical protein
MTDDLPAITDFSANVPADRFSQSKARTRELFADAVDRCLYRLEREQETDETAREYVRTHRPGVRAARRQFRRIGLPRCIACHRLILPWQAWVANWEEWAQHHACYHVSLTRLDAEAVAEGLDTDNWLRCCFCGEWTARALAARAAGIRPGDPKAWALARRLNELMAAPAALDWFRRDNPGLDGLSPATALRRGQGHAVKALISTLEKDSRP